jgi:ABC-type amino acid transport substrate-binding protein
MRKLLFCIIISILFLRISTPSYAQSDDILWTEEELKFIEADPVIRLGIDPTFVPFEFIDTDGNYKGIAADYIKLLRQKTGLQMEVVEGMTWPQTYDKALAGEIDVLPAVSMTSERVQDFLFSKPYYHFKRVIVTRDTNSSISGIEDLNETTVAVQKNSSHHSYLLSYPRINLSLYETVEKALTAVANGTETAFVGNLATNNYLIRSTGLTNLKFVAFEAEKQLSLHFAVRKDYPVLVSIINKALATVTVEERISINNKWIDLKTELDYAPIIRIVLIIGSIILVVLLVSAYWIIRLRKEIEKRKLIQVDLEKAKQ